MQVDRNHRAMFKYANRITGRIEFHRNEMPDATHRLIRKPDAATGHDFARPTTTSRPTATKESKEQ